jgi:hypothetical protein
MMNCGLMGSCPFDLSSRNVQKVVLNCLGKIVSIRVGCPKRGVVSGISKNFKIIKDNAILKLL